MIIGPPSVPWLVDRMQEFLLEAETARLQKITGHASKSRETLYELLHAYEIDRQYGAERCACQAQPSIFIVIFPL